MFMRCPHCGFLVALITARDGVDARCPQCQGVLRMDAVGASPADASHADGALVETSPSDSPAEALPSEEVGTDTDTDADAADVDLAAVGHGVDRVDGVDDVATPDASVQHYTPADPEAPPAAPRTTPQPPRLVTAPRFARRTLSMVDAGPRWPGVAVILALALLLAIQLLLSQRAELAGQPRWRPALERVCGALGCSLPAWREPEAFAMVTRSVRPSPVHPGVLEITATFRNDAAREQAWPVLLLSLSDIHGQTVGARAFQPADYRDLRTTGDTLAPGQTVTVLLDVVEPAPDTVAFSFDFR